MGKDDDTKTEKRLDVNRDDAQTELLAALNIDLARNINPRTTEEAAE